MNPQKILLPIDLRNCPVDAFPLVNRIANGSGANVTLLHVITLNILAPERRIYDELASEAHSALARLAQQYLPSAGSLETRVRFGNVVDEILTEAETDQSDLIIIPIHRKQELTALRAGVPLKSRGLERILREAGCGVCVAGSAIWFNCERAWRRPDAKAPARNEANAEPHGLLWAFASRMFARLSL